MYYVSLYFDPVTEERIQSMIDKVARKSGNSFMTEGRVPPHMTLAAFETQKESDAIDIFVSCVQNMRQTEIFIPSVGMFLPNSIYLSAVLNKELFGMNLAITMDMAEIEDCNMSKYYMPFQWLPHITVGKTLTKDELRLAFEVLQHQFGPFKGKVTRIGLAKTNPYRDLVIYELEEC